MDRQHENYAGSLRGSAHRLALAALFCLFAAIIALLPQPKAYAQAWPSRPIRMVVPLPPGGAVDTVARVTAAGLSERLGVPILIDNRGGASGTIGVMEAVRSQADGHTLLFASADTLVILPQVRKSLPFDTARDLTAIAKVSDVYLIFAANPKFPAQTMKELLELAKAKPGEIGVASAGNGTLHHITIEYLNGQAGVKLGHVPYSGGGPAAAAVIGGHVPVLISGLNVFKAIQAGQLRGLAVAKETRSALLPAIPTLEEVGYKGMVSSSWFGVFGPAGLPAAIASRINKELLAVASAPKFQQQMAALGADAGPLGQDEFVAFIANDARRWRQVVETARIKIDE